MTLMKLRAWLSMLSLVGVVALAVLVILHTGELSAVQMTFLAPIALGLLSEVKTAGAYLFDGTPTDPDTKKTTVNVTNQPAATPAAPSPQQP